MSSTSSLEQAIYNLLLKPTLQIPISSARILAHLIADLDGQCAATGLKLRLSSQTEVNQTLEKMSQRDVIVVQREPNASGLHVISVKNDLALEAASKRKREDAERESAKVKGDSMHSSAMALRMKYQPMLSSLPDPAVQDIFALLQKPTARQRLLAEQVRKKGFITNSVLIFYTDLVCVSVR